MLADRWSAEEVRRALVPSTRRRQFPAAADRGAWEGLLTHPLRRRQADRVIALAECDRREPWPQVLASQSLAFRRQGDRLALETPSFARRSRLARAAIAEACEGRGRFLDEIVDGLWLICDEASWIVPAHYFCLLGRNPDDPLPDDTLPGVDLFQAETAHALAECLALHEAALTEVSPVLVRRLRAILHRRVVAPVRDREEWIWWNGHNNWAPWVASSTLHTAAVVCTDDDELVRVAYRLMGVCDRFIGTYHSDGGCDEGPMYWGVAAGALLCFLEGLSTLTGGKIEIFDQPLIREMGAYVHRAHLGGSTLMTFADARPGGGIRASVAWRYGVRTGDAELRNVALLSQRHFDPSGPVEPLLSNSGNAGLMPNLLRELWWMDPAAEPRPPQPQADTWLDGLQVWVGRSAGLTIAAKAGHNAENHNHNDVGQAIVLVDDEPMILDVGCGIYTGKTFSAQRYEHWFLSAVGHNVPRVDGFLQQPGRDFAARDVTCTRGTTSTLSMDLAACYAAEAGIRSLRREFSLDRTAGTLSWTDTISAPGRSELSLRILTHREVVIGDGEVRLRGPRSDLRITFDASAVTCLREDQPAEDGHLAKHWGPVITGLRFRTAIAADGSGRLGLCCARLPR